MQTLEEYKEWYARFSHDSLIEEIFKLSHANAKLLDRNTKLETRQKVIDWNIEIQKSLEIENLKTEMPRAAVRAPLGRPYARMKRERVGRAGGIAAARAVVFCVRVSVPR